MSLLSDSVRLWLAFLKQALYSVWVACCVIE